MKRLVRIADKRNRVFLRMPEVLAALPPEASSLQWHILDLREVVATGESERSVLALEERVFASPTGLPVSFAELSDFADSTRQVIDGLFVATADSSQPPERFDEDATIIDRSEVVVAAVDSSFWLVSGPDRVLDHLKTVFRDVTEQEPSSTPLRAWGPSPSER